MTLPEVKVTSTPLPRKSILDPARVAASLFSGLGSAPVYEFHAEDDEYDALFDSLPNFGSAVFDDPETNYFWGTLERSRVRRLTGENRAAKIARCGTWYSYIDPLIGVRKPYQFRCRLKSCTFCGTERGIDLRLRVERAAAASTLHRIDLPHDAARAFLRTLPSDAQYLRLPQITGHDVIFITNAGHKAAILQPVELSALKSLDWTALQNTPDGALISGSMPKIASPEQTTETKVVYLSYYKIEAAQTELAHKCELLAIADTFELAPSAPTIQRAIIERQRAFEKHLLAHGVSYTSFPAQRNVKLCYIDWHNGITQTIDKLATAGMLRRDQLDTFLQVCDTLQARAALQSPQVRALLSS